MPNGPTGKQNIEDIRLINLNLNFVIIIQFHELTLKLIDYHDRVCIKRRIITFIAFEKTQFFYDFIHIWMNYS